MNYRKCMVKIPQCKEDRTPADLEAFIDKYVKGSNEIFVKYPYAIEAQVVSIEDAKNVYKIATDDQGEMKLRKYP